jgi:hypothetical protein
MEKWKDGKISPSPTKGKTINERKTRNPQPVTRNP